MKTSPRDFNIESLNSTLVSNEAGIIKGETETSISERKIAKQIRDEVESLINSIKNSTQETSFLEACQTTISPRLTHQAVLSGREIVNFLLLDKAVEMVKAQLMPQEEVA